MKTARTASDHDGLLVIGLTGSIGMGKSTVTEMLRDLGVPVFDADQTVHELYAQGGAAVQKVGELFPDCIENGAVNREKLGQVVLASPEKLRALEEVVHPLVNAAERNFLRQARHQHKYLVVLDIPLLFESGGQDRCDRIICVTANAATQRQRVMARPGMTAEKFAAILAEQIPDAEKRRRSDYVIDNSGSRDATRHQLEVLLAKLNGENMLCAKLSWIPRPLVSIPCKVIAWLKSVV